MVKLFLSHASEDKNDFVKPLADALLSSFEVWYDAYVLQMGDSLLKKINEGLASCDYGIVILSNHFFSKKWPQAELDGLFALEESNRKVILPIWKDISAAEIRAHSPILAGRFAAQASSGIEAVVAQIHLATDTGDRKSQLSGRQSTLERFKQLDGRVSASIASQQKLQASGTIEEIAKAGTNLLNAFVQALAGFNQSGATLKIQVKTGVDKKFGDRELRKFVVAQGPSYVCVRFEYDEEVTCATERTRMRIKLWRSIPQPMWEHPVGPKEAKITELYNEEFAPGFDAKLKLCWRSKFKTLTGDQLVDYALEKFVHELEAYNEEAA